MSFSVLYNFKISASTTDWKALVDNDQIDERNYIEHWQSRNAAKDFRGSVHSQLKTLYGSHVARCDTSCTEDFPSGHVVFYIRSTFIRSRFMMQAVALGCTGDLT